MIKVLKQISNGTFIQANTLFKVAAYITDDGSLSAFETPELNCIHP
jgi:hypothetical protein